LEMSDRRQEPSVLDIYQRLEGIDPLILLKLRESEVRAAIELTVLEHTLYTTYIGWLDARGMISEAPLKNYLSANLETIPR